MAKTKIEAIDLFCGAGGLTCGLRAAGIKVLAGIDLDSACKFAFEENNGAQFIAADISTVKGKDLAKHYSNDAIRLLAGCAPCQPFSTLAQGKTDASDAKWGLLGEFARLVKELRPELVTMENVPGVTKHSPYDKFIAALIGLGYHVSAKQVKCADYGIPQVRRRFVLVASRLGPIDAPKPLGTTVSVRDAISHLPAIGSGETDPKDPLHKARALTPINLKRIRKSKPGGTWMDWPEELRSPCHRTALGATYKSVYARMKWDLPSPTITTQASNFGTGRFGHPTQDRAISLREAAILQSFPDSYKFIPNGERAEFASVGRMIGNAVPPKLAEEIGRTFSRHIKEYKKV